MRINRVCRAVGGGTLALSLAIATAGPATAAPGDISSAQAIRSTPVSSGVANCPPPPPSPAPLLTTIIGPLTIEAGAANCTNAGANSSIARVFIPGLTPALDVLVLGAINTSCTTGTAGTTSFSVISAGGVELLDDIMIDLGLLGIINVDVNETVNEPGFRVVRGVHITGLGLDIVLAESRCSTTYALSGTPLELGEDVVSAISPDGGGIGSALPLLVTGVAAVVLWHLVLVSMIQRRRRAASVR